MKKLFIGINAIVLGTTGAVTRDTQFGVCDYV